MTPVVYLYAYVNLSYTTERKLLRCESRMTAQGLFELMKSSVIKLFPASRSHLVAGAVVFLVVVAGVFLLMSSSAASPVISMEAEAGNIGSGAVVAVDSGASDGKGVHFKPADGGILLSEAFSAPDGVFVSSSDFWNSSDLGASKNSEWMSEAGTMYRRANTGTADNSMFRMWTRRNDMGYVKMEMDMKFNGFFSGTEEWHGINVWLNESYCTPESNTNPCTKVNDGNGPSGYAVDFMNRSGDITILKKVKGDTRAKWPQNATSYSAGGTYYYLKGMKWSPVVGRTYKFAGQTIKNSNNTTTIKLMIDGQVLLEYIDNGSIGGPQLTGTRVGLRSDFANYNVDNIVISR